jgi:hypothetical protein
MTKRNTALPSALRLKNTENDPDFISTFVTGDDGGA